MIISATNGCYKKEAFALYDSRIVDIFKRQDEVVEHIREVTKEILSLTGR